MHICPAKTPGTNVSQPAVNTNNTSLAMPIACALEYATGNLHLCEHETWPDSSAPEISHTLCRVPSCTRAHVCRRHDASGGPDTRRNESIYSQHTHTMITMFLFWAKQLHKGSPFTIGPLLSMGLSCQTPGLKSGLCFRTSPFSSSPCRLAVPPSTPPTPSAGGSRLRPTASSKRPLLRGCCGFGHGRGCAKWRGERLFATPTQPP